MVETEPFYADAFAQYEAGQLKEAVEAFRLLCFRHPFEGKFWFGLAASLQEIGDYEGALQAWAVSSILKSSDPYPHFHAAECLISLQNLEDGMIALEKAAERMGEDLDLQEKIDVLRKQWGKTE